MIDGCSSRPPHQKNSLILVTVGTFGATKLDIFNEKSGDEPAVVIKSVISRQNMNLKCFLCLNRIRFPYLTI